MIVRGRVWKLGSGVTATDLLPARHDRQAMNRQWEDCRTHLLEEVDPAIAREVRVGDLIVAGSGFGTGHAHYYQGAVMTCRAAGIAGVFAEGIGGMFRRAAIDFGLPAAAINGVSALIEQGELLEVDLAGGIARNPRSGASSGFRPESAIVRDILAAGGSEPWALRRVGYVPAHRA